MTWEPLNKVGEESYDPWPVLDEFRNVDTYRHELALSLVKSRCDLDATIVDVGCGDGILIGMLAEAGYHNLFGTDISWEGLTRTHHKYPYVTTLQADLTKVENLWQGILGGFYAAICTEVLEHLPSDDDVQHVMRLIHDALVPGGYAIISIPDDNICEVDSDHRRLFNPGDEVTILKDAGFVNVQPIEYRYSDQHPRPWMYAVGQRSHE